MEEEKEKRVEEEQKGQENTEEKTRKGREKEAVVGAHDLKGPPQENKGREHEWDCPWVISEVTAESGWTWAMTLLQQIQVLKHLLAELG